MSSANCSGVVSRMSGGKTRAGAGAAPRGIARACFDAERQIHFVRRRQNVARPHRPSAPSAAKCRAVCSACGRRFGARAHRIGQFDQARQEAAERLAAARRRNQQRRFSRARGRQQRQLMRTRRPSHAQRTKRRKDPAEYPPCLLGRSIAGISGPFLALARRPITPCTQHLIRRKSSTRSPGWKIADR